MSLDRQTARYTDALSTIVPLGSGASWNSLGEKAKGNELAFALETDQDGTLLCQVSMDNTNWATIGSYQYRAGTITNRPHKFVIYGRYARLVFNNENDGAQTYMRLFSWWGTFNDLTVPLNGTVARDADAKLSITYEADYLRALGKIDGEANYNKFGEVTGFNSADGEVVLASSKHTYTPLTAASTYTIAYNNATDGLGQNGALTLSITHVNSEGKAETFTHVLSNTGSDVTAQSGFGILRCQVATAGSTNTNGNDITVTATTGGGTQAFMTAGYGTTQQMQFRVPDNADALVWGLDFHSAKVSGGGSSPRIQVKGYVKLPSGVVLTIIDVLVDTSDNPDYKLSFGKNPYVVPAGSHWWVTVNTDQNNTSATAWVLQTLKENTSF